MAENLATALGGHRSQRLVIEGQRFEMCLPTRTVRTGPVAFKREQGIALIVVLWLVSLLSLLAATVLSTTRSHVYLAQRSIETIQAEAAADSAIRLVLIELGSPGNTRWGSESSRQVEIFGQRVGLTLTSEAGLIDLNAGQDELLFALFASQGLADSAARAHVSRIIDWRDADDDRSRDGAEYQDYRAAGLSYGPRNAPFETVGELRLVLGLNGVSDETIKSLTVHTRRQNVLPIAAPESVQKALRWADAHQLGGRSWSGDGTSTTSTQKSMPGEVARVRACSEVGKIKLCREARARLTGSNQRPFQILSWQTD